MFFDISEFDDADFYESKIDKSAMEKIKLLNKALVSGQLPIALDEEDIEQIIK